MDIYYLTTWCRHDISLLCFAPIVVLGSLSLWTSQYMFSERAPAAISLNSSEQFYMYTSVNFTPVNLVLTRDHRSPETHVLYCAVDRYALTYHLIYCPDV